MTKPKPKNTQEKPKPPQALNMAREYRAELKKCRAERRRITRASAAVERAAVRAFRAADREHSARIAATTRSAKREQGVLTKAAATIARRIGILEGRLS